MAVRERRANRRAKRDGLRQNKRTDRKQARAWLRITERLARERGISLAPRRPHEASRVPRGAARRVRGSRRVTRSSSSRDPGGSDSDEPAEGWLSSDTDEGFRGALDLAAKRPRPIARRRAAEVTDRPVLTRAAVWRGHLLALDGKRLS